LIIETLTNVQKRKRAETIAEDTIIVDTTDWSSSTTIDNEFDDGRHRLPFNKEDDPDASDIDQPDKEALTNSTLFWSTQFVISKQDDDEIGLGKASLEHQKTKTLALLCKISII
jgi:hypothetical protein